MSEKEMELGAYFKIKFKPEGHQFGFVEILRENSHRTNLMMTMENIALFKANLEWLETKLLMNEKSHYDNPPGADFQDAGDDEC